MALFIDTHSHIYTEKFEDDWRDTIHRAKESGISKIILPGIDSTYAERQKLLYREYPYTCKLAFGLHPTEVKENFIEELSLIESLIMNENPVAVGEIGIDLYWDKSFLNQQKQAFIFQIELAKKHNLPVIIHVREAFRETFEILDQLNDERLKGVFHSFSGTADDAQKIIAYGGFKLGINGTVTYKKSDLPEILSKISPELIVPETDSPWLPPVPHRGQRNEPAYMLRTIEKLADIYGLNKHELSEIFEKNTKEIFPGLFL
jgi:TatD DNase family protein